MHPFFGGLPQAPTKMFVYSSGLRGKFAKLLVEKSSVGSNPTTNAKTNKTLEFECFFIILYKKYLFYFKFMYNLIVIKKKKGGIKK